MITRVCFNTSTWIVIFGACLMLLKLDAHAELRVQLEPFYRKDGLIYARPFVLDHHVAALQPSNQVFGIDLSGTFVTNDAVALLHRFPNLAELRL